MTGRDLIIFLGGEVAPAVPTALVGWRGRGNSIIRRRSVLASFVGAAILPLSARGQSDRLRRIGVLASAETRPIQSFTERLRELGWIAGKNVRFDYRWAEADDTRQPALVAELVALPVDLILTWYGHAIN